MSAAPTDSLKMLKKWSRVTSVGPESGPGTPQPQGSDSTPYSAASTVASLKLERGRQKSILYGKAFKEEGLPDFSSAAEIGRKPLASQNPAAADFAFWQAETLDPKTGRTTDAMILHNISGEDKGVCRDAMMGRACHRGAQCPFSHPVRHLQTNMGRDLYLGMALMSMRYDLTLGSCAIVRITDVVSPFCISISVLADSSSIGELEPYLAGKKPKEPEGFWNLLSAMQAHYEQLQRQGQRAAQFPSLNDVNDAFVAVQCLFQGSLRWMRGIVTGTDQQPEGIKGDFSLKVRLPDVGKHVSVTSPKSVWRLDNKFLAEPWFATRVGLANVILPSVNSSNETTRQWFFTLLKDKIAWIRVVDEEYDTLLVELYTQLEECGGIRSVNECLIEETVAVYRPIAGDVAADFIIDDQVVDSDEEDEDCEFYVVPG